MTTLEASTQAYLKGRNISLASTAVDQAKDAALTSLKSALRTGDPVDAQAVTFLMDYFNDSDTDIATLRNVLYGSEALMDKYVIDQMRPMTEALAPLMMSAQFATDIGKRDATLLAALKNVNTMGLQPPVQALAMLATLPSFTNPGTAPPVNVTGNEAAAYFAEQFIAKAAATGQAVSLDLMNTYIAFNPAKAVAFMDGCLRSNWLTAHSGLMDVYRQLNPLGANSPTGGVTTQPGDLNIGFDTNPPAIKGWSWFALQRVLADVNNRRPVDEALLRQLHQVNPFAAAYASWTVLAQQVTNDEEFSALGLEILSDVKPDLAKAIAVRRLERNFGVPNQLLQTVDDKAVADYDGLTNDATPTIRIKLDAMGKDPKVGDKVVLWMDGNLQTEAALTADDIQRGYKDVTSNDLSPWQEAHQAVTRIKDGVTGELSEASPGLMFLLDSRAPTVKSATFNSEVYPPGSGSSNVHLWIDLDSISELSAVSTPSKVELTVMSWLGTSLVVNVDVTQVMVDAVNKRIQVTAWPANWIDAANAIAAKVEFSSITDSAGNAAPVTVELNSRGWGQQVVPQGPTPQPDPPLAPRMLDHSALKALQALDAAAATKWRDFYTSAGLMGTAPAPAPAPAPAAGNAAGTSPPLTAEELLNLDLETLVYRTFMGRFDAIDDLLKQQLASVQKINEDMAKLSDLLGAVNGLVERIPADTAPSKKISEIDPKVDDASDGTRINAAIGQIPGLILFDETKGIPAPGEYNRGFVTKGGLLAVQTNLKAKLDSMSNMQQHETLRTQMMNSKRLECLTAISNLLEAANNCKKEIMRNMA